VDNKATEDNNKEKSVKIAFKDRLKGIGKSILFFTILIAIFLGSSKFYDNKAANNLTFLTQRNLCMSEMKAAKEDSYDVLFEGDSLVYSAISPLDMWKQKGFTSYVAGTQGQSIPGTYYILKEALEKHKPKVLFIESCVILKDFGSTINKQEVIDETKNHYFHVIRCHDMWKSLLYNKEYEYTDYKGYILKGYAANTVNHDYMIKTDKSATIPDMNKYYMDKIIKLCKENDCKLGIISVPTEVKPAGSKATKYEEYNCLKKYAQEKSIDFIDMNMMCLEGEINIDWSKCCADFEERVEKRGNEHLNAIGSKIVSDKLADIIAQKYDLKDRSLDENYSDWDKSYATYNIDRQEALGKIDECLKRNEKIRNKKQKVE